MPIRNKAEAEKEEMRVVLMIEAHRRVLAKAGRCQQGFVVQRQIAANLEARIQETEEKLRAFYATCDDVPEPL